MHKARGQSHSRTSPAIQVTCFPHAGSFPLHRVAFHLVSVIHLSFSRWDRDSCVADTSPLCIFYFAVTGFFFFCFLLLRFLSLFLSVLLYLCLSIILSSLSLLFKSKALHITTSFRACKLFPKKVGTYGLGRTYVVKFVMPPTVHLRGSDV